MTRYFRLFAALARFGLARELAFRGNLLAKVFVEIMWLGIMLVFYLTLFQNTESIANLTKPEYLFFVGCYFTMSGLIETFFLSNCNEFADLIRSGDLDFILLKPIDEQFLVSCRSIDWTTLPNVLLGIGVMGVSLGFMEWNFHPGHILMFLGTFLCGLGLAYGFLMLLTSTGVWLVRNQSLFELWWLFTSLMRYPRTMFTGSLGFPIGVIFSFVIPVLLVISVPADSIIRKVQGQQDPNEYWFFVGFLIVVTLLLLVVSRWFFRLSLRRYRSASS